MTQKDEGRHESTCRVHDIVFSSADSHANQRWWFGADDMGDDLTKFVAVMAASYKLDVDAGDVMNRSPLWRPRCN
jgi:hypothetical protein